MTMNFILLENDETNWMLYNDQKNEIDFIWNLLAM